MAQPTGQPLHT